MITGQDLERQYSWLYVQGTAVANTMEKGKPQAMTIAYREIGV
jgi:hypothetical protein